MSVGAVRRLESRCTLRPEPRGGVVYYRLAEVQLADQFAMNPKPRRGYQDAGWVAAEAFRLFAAGADLRTVVTELRVLPAAVDSLYEEWRTADLEQRFEERERKRRDEEVDRELQRLGPQA